MNAPGVAGNYMLCENLTILKTFYPSAFCLYLSAIYENRFIWN